MGVGIGIVVGILILSLLMFIHELGHFIAGRILKFKIIEFSLFMGPVLFSKTSKKTGIKYSIKLFPIGASVRFHGEEGMGEDESEDPDSFVKMAKWKRAIVIGTGPLVNIFAGILALFILFSTIGFTSTYVSSVSPDSQAALAGIKESDRIVELNGSGIWTSIDYILELNFLKADEPAKIVFIRTGVPGQIERELIPVKKTTYRLGISISEDKETRYWDITLVDSSSNGGKPALKVGDVITDINGVPTTDKEKSYAQVAQSGGKSITLGIIRDNKKITVMSTPTIFEYYSDRGIAFSNVTGIGASIGESFKYSSSIVKLTFKGISKIFSGEIAAKDGLAGPVGVVDLVGSVVNQDVPFIDKISNLLWMFALISLNLGVFNLLPIPALDGSHLLLIGVEAIRGKRLPRKVENIIVLTGFLFIIALAILGFIFDIMRISGR
ncbi:MAG: RIP metalloprotease RseP [Saccharofermentanales bacterium]